MPHALILVAFILSVIDLIRSRAQSILGWAILCLSLALAWPLLR